VISSRASVAQHTPRGVRAELGIATLSDAELLANTRALIGRSNRVLAALLLLGPHLNRENLGEVMARAKHRSKKEIAKLVRILDPLPDVPARIEALGPLHPGVPRTNPTWAEQVASFCPVRELTPGDRPRDWVELDALPALARVNDPRDSVAPNDVSALARMNHPLRFKVQFSTTDEYVDLMERAAALLSNHREPNGIEQIHLRALRLLVERLEKRRFGAPAKSPKSAASAKRGSRSKKGQKTAPKPAARTSRHIPARVRRAVFERDGARCTHADATGQRCRETRRLELHHLVPFARGGEHNVTNLTLRCAPHNALAAELAFGPEHIAKQRDSSRHSSEQRELREAPV
jgi:hypothetical protein